MNQSRTILVTGATGAQGGAAAQALIGATFRVRAFVRDVESEAAKALAEMGCELCRGDFETPASLEAAMMGVDGVFSVQLPPTPADPDREIRTGRALIEAARRAGVHAFVHTSVARADEQEKFCDWEKGRWSTGYWKSKSVVNRFVRTAGFKYWTILKPAFMMDNFIVPKAKGMFPSLAHGALTTALSKETRLDLIAAEDVGRFAAAAFADPNRFNEQEIPLAAQSLTMGEVAAILSRASGKPVIAQSLSEAEMIAAGASEGLVSSQAWNNVEGYRVRISDLVKWGLPLCAFADWIASRTDRLRIGPGAP